jgi:hypothetical protein
MRQPQTNGETALAELLEGFEMAEGEADHLYRHR